ncbi:alpha-ketoglutarate-dependent dioxygenase AlkB family protein [Macromonas bipunctata]|uniref:alpha-ketoglutarate-dependent dioxygenase AlkB family protein n=1 Tax=Macromonas bipunctata TaxID=183670 RepID=UPI0014737668|nr:alpha-ketoglutarate-dependent dioxygenase AlkB [Macromonas bipunctata]
MNSLFENHEVDLPFQISLKSEWIVQSINGWEGYSITVPNGCLIYIKNFFDKKVSGRALEYFQEAELLDWHRADWKNALALGVDNIQFKNIKWKQDFIKIYGKKIPLPRLTSWYGDSNKMYTYSGITSVPNEWNAGLLYMKKEIEKFSQIDFNSVLLNWYRDGEDCLGWHADDEKELGKNPVIASANFGEERDFLIRRNDDHSQKIKIFLGHGSLLIMKGELQHFWQHSVPKRKKVEGSRFNLTFRRIGVDS